ncbi:MAG TPA: 30S ribosome-binding factor RbfA [Caldilineae bacterium]|nr:30S ribosome-binding factor RbfA [Caldilineae bacterium]
MNRAYRKERLDELLWRELNNIIVYELNDPRLHDVTVDRVDVARDLQTARVYITPLDEDVDVGQLQHALARAQGHLRSEIAARVQLRRVPELYFKIGQSHQQAQRVEEILDSLPAPTVELPPGSASQ